MAVATVNISGSITGTATGTRVIGPITLASATANGQVTQVVLQAGFNAITIPTTPAPSGCIIVLPATNTSVTTLKGVTGDTGIAIGKTTTTVLNWDATAIPAALGLTSVSTQTGLVTEISFF